MVVETLRSVLNVALDQAITTSENVHAAFAPIPESRDDDEDYDAGPQSAAGRILEALKTQVVNGKHDPTSLMALEAVLDAVFNAGEMDDRKLLLEKALYLMSHIPEGSISKSLQDKVISLLWHDLPHPPSTYVSDEYVYREADGSKNNPHIPDLGKAGSPYAKSVQGTTAMPGVEQPDPGLIFDALLKREAFVPHPAGNSAMMFGFATLVIHTCFRTNHSDWTQNETSSYVDLSPLYGNNQEAQNKVRNKDGRGRLWNDVFAEDRLLFLPPISCAFLVLYCRNHNFVADKILAINERGTWVDPNDTAKWSKLSEADKLKQDEEIFQTARLINCGHFAKAVFADYVAAILGLVADCNPWTLNPFEEIRKSDHTIVERGQGNGNSVEFNLLYRWHSTLSQQDERWVDGMWQRVFKVPSDEITIDMFKNVTESLKQQSKKDVKTWTFNNMVRGEDGKFKDEELAKIFMDATLAPAGAFKARGTPASMRIVEIMTIRMARKWGVCTLNEFRKSLGLKPYKTFEEWNPRKEIWQAAQKLYETVDRLELFPGLQAEETKVPGPGAGLCPGFTVSRAILADAIALTRGDRFYNQNFTPFNYTAWGYKDCQRDPTNPGFGSALGPLLLRTLPNHFSENSVFTWFPMIVPDRMRKTLESRSLAERYTFNKPIPTSDRIPIENYGAVLDLTTKSSRALISTYSSRVKDIVAGPGYLLNIDDHRRIRNARLLNQALFHHGDFSRAARIIDSKLHQLISRKSFDLVGRRTRNIDIVKDILNLAPIHWIAEELGLPLKTHDYPRGVIFEQQADQGFKDIFSYIFHENDPAFINQLKDHAVRHAKVFQSHMLTNIKSIGTGGFFGLTTNYVREKLWSMTVGTRNGSDHFYQVLNSSGLSEQELVNDVLAVAVLGTVELSHMLVHIVNFYMEEENEGYREEIIGIANSNDLSSSTLLQIYAREALRLDPVSPGVPREVTSSLSVNSTAGTTVLHPGERVFLSLKKANIDDPTGKTPRTQVDLNNGRNYDIFLGDGVAALFGESFILTIAAQVLKTIFSLKNLRRAPGPSGQLRRYKEDVHGTSRWFYLDVKQVPTLWPTSVLLQYDLH